MSSEQQQKYSFESYLASECAKEFRNEFVDGQVGVDRVHFVPVRGLWQGFDCWSDEMSDQYEKDFYAWANAQAFLLRSGNFVQADIDHIVEEIESMGKSELRELENRLALLFMHLLKWRYQPERCSRSWELTIKEQRRKLRRHLDQNPSLKDRLPQAIDDAYGDAILEAARETDLPEARFPQTCPFTFDQVMDDAFWPDEEPGV